MEYKEGDFALNCIKCGEKEFWVTENGARCEKCGHQPIKATQ